ncbi:hypothetical protein [Gordonia sp. QH-12]|uniref:hypothetical protein n=1 Tax=Gordonia sp. QH-12 TaxID=1437876 RepID=UPI0012E74754|nr:hypothetical protein [Gordonia sp. QH-12]
MDSGVVAAIIAASASVLTAVPLLVHREGSPLARRNIQKDLDIVRNLPEGKAKDALQRSIEIRTIIISANASDTIRRSHLSQLALLGYSLLLLATAIYLGLNPGIFLDSVRHMAWTLMITLTVAGFWSLLLAIHPFLKATPSAIRLWCKVVVMSLRLRSTRRRINSIRKKAKENGIALPNRDLEEIETEREELSNVAKKLRRELVRSYKLQL